MENTKHTRKRRKGIPGISIMRFGFHASTSETAGTFHPSVEPIPMGRCDKHQRLHVQRDDCQGFQRATSREIAEDTFSRF